MDASKLNIDPKINMAMLFYIELHELRKMKSQAYIYGELHAYNDCLEEIFSAIHTRLASDEREKVMTKFRVAHQALMKESKITKSLLRAIDIMLTGFMWKYHMILPKTKKAKGVQHLNDRYGLTEEDKKVKKNGKL